MDQEQRSRKQPQNIIPQPPEATKHPLFRCTTWPARPCKWLPHMALQVTRSITVGREAIAIQNIDPLSYVHLSTHVRGHPSTYSSIFTGVQGWSMHRENFRCLGSARGQTHVPGRHLRTSRVRGNTVFCKPSRAGSADTLLYLLSKWSTNVHRNAFHT